MRNALKALILLPLLCLTSFVIAQQTQIEGVVLDNISKEPLSFANVLFEGTTNGLVTDLDGKFNLQTEDLSLDKIVVNYLGYQEKIITIKPGEKQTIEITLISDSEVLGEVVVKATKKVKKDTAAITLFRRIVANKPINRPENFEYYSYEDYTKTEFDVFNIKESLMNRKVLRPFDFVFENIDTTKEGNVFLPVLLKERIAQYYYRKNPKKVKQIVKADQFSGIDNIELFESVEYTFDEIDIYQNIIVIKEKGFTSPFAKGALASYKYFLSDSTEVDGVKSYKLEFTPRRKGDLCFTGEAWIDDETAAIKSVDLYLLKQANINYVSNLWLKQNFERVEGKYWFKTYEQMAINLNITQKEEKQSIRILRTSSRKKININIPPAEEVLIGDAYAVEENAYNRPKEYWKTHRHQALKRSEAAIYTMVEKVQETKAYKRYNFLGYMFASGRLRFGPVEFGPYLQFFSWNAIEGHRYRLGFRTHRDAFKKRLRLEGYVAYGDRDKLIKYSGGFRYRLKTKNNRLNAFGGYYRFDWTNYGKEGATVTHDHILSSLFRTSPLDNLFLIRQGHGYFQREWMRGFMNTFSMTHKKVYSWPGSYEFTPETGSVTTGQDNFSTVEFKASTRWSPGSKFSENPKKEAIRFARPVFNLDYTFAPKNVLGSDYNYHRLDFGVGHRQNWGVGRTETRLTAGKTFGHIPYPLLKVHNGNEGYLYDRYAYHAMNSFEYVSDTWAALWVEHKFEGLLLNAIPLIKKLKMRTMVHGKILAGTLSKENQSFLDMADIKPIDGIYAELGFGITNVAKLFRIDFVWRLTQRDLPSTPGVRLKFYLDPSF